MAKKPDGAAAGTQRVTFTKGAAERIGKVVRTVEAGNRDQGPLEFGARVGGAGGKVFRICTFTGSWPIGSTKTVTFKGVTSTPNTVSATNLFFPITSTATSSTDCAIAKDGTAWYLIDVPFQTATAVFVSATATATYASGVTSQSVVTDVTLSATLNTSSCAISVARTLTTSSVQVVTATATAVFAQSTFTATFVRFGGQ